MQEVKFDMSPQIDYSPHDLLAPLSHKRKITFRNQVGGKSLDSRTMQKLAHLGNLGGALSPDNLSLPKLVFDHLNSEPSNHHDR